MTNRTQYDVRPRRPVMPVDQQIRMVQANVAETGPQTDHSEPFVTLIEGDGFKAMVLLVVLPAVKNIRSELLTNINMAEGQRQRLVSALATFESLLVKVYEKAGQPLPKWLAAQFK